VLVAVEEEQLDRSAPNGVVTLVARQVEVVEVGFGTGRLPVVVSQRGEEPVRGCPGAEPSRVRCDELVIVLADVGVDPAAPFG
jgi:hypothetical protein